jgi:hypothetical protein
MRRIIGFGGAFQAPVGEAMRKFEVKKIQPRMNANGRE